MSKSLTNSLWVSKENIKSKIKFMCKKKFDELLAIRQICCYWVMWSALQVIALLEYMPVIHFIRVLIFVKYFIENV